MIRGRPYPLWYRRLLLWWAALLDRRVQRIRAKVKRHTPYRSLPKAAVIAARMTASEVVRNDSRLCTCPPGERPPVCWHKYALTDCLKAHKLHSQLARDQVNAL